MRFKQLICLVLSCSLVLGMVSFSANAYAPPEETIVVQDDISAAAGPVVVFVAGILTGYIIDGVAIAATGASLGEWVARALNYLTANPGSTEIYLPSPNTGPKW